MSRLVSNKKAGFNYEILETLEAGMSLFGYEVKALKKSQGSLEGAYVIVRGNEAFLLGSYIPPYQPANTPESYDPYRVRKLLLHEKEIYHLLEKEKELGLTIVPISVYNKGSKIKLEIAVARGKKKYDKRETLKKKDAKREINRLLKRQ